MSTETIKSVETLESRIIASYGIGRHCWGGHAVWALLVGTLVTVALNVVGCAP